MGSYVRGFAFAFFLLCAPSVVDAHAFGQQYSLPLPIYLYVFGGTMAFAVSCVLIAFAGHAKKLAVPYARELTQPTWSRLVGLAEFVSLILLLGGLAAGFLDTQLAAHNLLLYLFWIGLVLVVPYVSVLLGGIWELGNPFRVIAERLQGSRTKVEWRLGYLPAVIGYFLLITLELFLPAWGTTPWILATLLLLYLLYLIAGSQRYGALTWIRYAELFSVFFGLASRLAPLELRNGKLIWSSPVRRLADEAASHLSLVLFILFALAATAYDGFRETSLMADIIVNVLHTDWQITSFIAFLLFPAAFCALYVAAMLAMKWLTKGTRSLTAYVLRFAFSLVPIMLAYHFAHYFSLMFNSFGFLIGADIVWYIQLAVIVLGHAYAAYLAHQIALTEFPEKKRALVSQLPLLVLMVFYTAIGLWILAQPFAPLAS